METENKPPSQMAYTWLCLKPGTKNWWFFSLGDFASIFAQVWVNKLIEGYWFNDQAQQLGQLTAEITHFKWFTYIAGLWWQMETFGRNTKYSENRFFGGKCHNLKFLKNHKAISK